MSLQNYVSLDAEREGRERLKKIRIKRYPPQNFPDLKSLWEIVVAPPLSNPHHPVIIEEMSEIVEIEVDDKAFKELVWLFKKYCVPCKPIDEGIEIRHVETKS